MTTILIDSNRNAYNKAFLFEKPLDIIQAHHPEDVKSALSRLSRTVEQGKYIAGFFSYELGYLLEPRLAHRIPEHRRNPLLWFAICETAEQLSDTEVENWLQKRINQPAENSYIIDNMKLSKSREDYRTAFNQAWENIASGDIYQLNLTFNAHFSFSGNPFALYHDLKRKQKMQHGAVIETEDFTIVSASPELFLTIDGRQAITAPMKGTEKRGHTLEADKKIKTALQNDPKSRAENLMIVDLMRNDLGRISETGSVEVTDLFGIETYPTLHQMTSWIRSSIKPDIRLQDWLPALHPPGSITGAPKVRAMEIINDLEQEERGAYTGAIGMICPQKQQEVQTYFNVGIRTLSLWPDGSGQMGIGSGVVSDSNADDEYDECILKMKFLTDPITDFELIETFAYTPDQGYLYYPWHLKRLKKTAEYFGFTHNMEKIEQSLREQEKELKNGFYRVRMLLSEKGVINISATPVDAPDPDAVMSFIISDKRMDKNDTFLYHKTTNRTFYDNEHKIQTEKYNCDEVVFLNNEEQITEGSRTNIFVELNGNLYTPPVECGLLAGTLRADLIANNKVTERILTINNLEQADKIYIGNSVRGLLKGKWNKEPAAFS